MSQALAARWSESQPESLSLISNMYGGWELDCIQLSPGPTRSFCRLFESQGLRIRLCMESVGAVNEVLTPNHVTFLSFPLGSEAPLRWSGIEIPCNFALIASSSFEGAVTLHDGYHVLEVELDHQLNPKFAPLAEVWENLKFDDSRRIRKMSPEILRFRNRLRDIMRSPAILDWLCSSTAAATALVNSVADDALSCFDLSHSDVSYEISGTETLKRHYAIFAAATKLIARDKGNLIRPEDLSREIGVSRKTLTTSFKLMSAVTPNNYLLKRRLNQAHARLINSNPQYDSVSQIATESGFGEFGRFSKYYRELFNERPSESLRRESAGLLHLQPSFE